MLDVFSPIGVTLLLALAAHPTKVAVYEVELGPGVDSKVAHLVTTLVASELRKLPSLSVTSQEDIQNLLGLNRQRQLLQCAEASCLAEIGGALGVDQMVTGSLSKLGESQVIVLRVVDVRRAQVLRDVNRRIQDPRPDAILDVLPAMVVELYPKEAAARAPVPTAAVTPPPQVEKSQAHRRTLAPWWLAGAGLVVGIAGVSMAGVELANANPQTNPATEVTRYGISWSQAQIGIAGEALTAVGAAALLGGLGWGLFRPSQTQAVPP
jgi:hypothetical protein